ncbi:MAG: hypothetical protein Q4C49_08540 [Bacillota bacterium]|nr:hypothetical protein [Bacillota bacterium]
MKQEQKDKSEMLFISIMKVAMGILSVFSFFYIINAIGWLDLEAYFPKPDINPIVLDEHTYTNKEQEVFVPSEEKKENFKEEEESALSSMFKGYADKMQLYFNKGFYYDLYVKEKEEKEKLLEKEKEKEEEKKKETEKQGNNYYQDDYGFFLNRDWNYKEDLEEYFPWLQW